MKTPERPTERLMVALRRPVEGQLLRVIEEPRASVREALRLQPDAVDRVTVLLGQAAAKLPDEPMAPERKAMLRRGALGELPSLLDQLATLLRKRQAALAGRGPKPELVAETEARLRTYAGLVQALGRGRNQAMDQRLLQGAFIAFILKRGLGEVIKRLEDPQLDAETRGRIRQTFLVLLTYREEILRMLEERRAEQGAQVEELRRATAEAEKDALVEEVRAAVRMGWKVDWETLKAAAIHHNRRQTQRG